MNYLITLQSAIVKSCCLHNGFISDCLLDSGDSTVQQNLGCCGSEWRNWFPDQPVTAEVEAPVPPAAPVTPALSPVHTVALERGSGPAVSPHTLLTNQHLQICRRWTI